jgi:hypothetical protein
LNCDLELWSIEDVDSQGVNPAGWKMMPEWKNLGSEAL